MLINPYKQTLEVIPGSRMLVESLGLIGATFQDHTNENRMWTITGLFTPLTGRALGGIRIKLQDQKGFITFCNQRDMELMLGLAKPGSYCPWANSEYPDTASRDFFGMCVDPEDLEDDLFERELHLRALMTVAPEYPDVIPWGYQFARRIHVAARNDVEDLHMMLYDCDPDTGLGPDTRFQTLTTRWTRIERNHTRWEAA